VATLVTKLQVFIQEINNTIDDTCHQTVQNFPRILREIEVLKQEAFMLKEQMKSVRDDLIKVEKNTVNESMKLLLDLDIMRTNMLSVQMSLQVRKKRKRLMIMLRTRLGLLLMLNSNEIRKLTTGPHSRQIWTRFCRPKMFTKYPITSSPCRIAWPCCKMIPLSMWTDAVCWRTLRINLKLS
jgi:hypothetical protein